MVSLILDHAQPRLSQARLGVCAGGLELDGSIWDQTWIDPITNTLMLRPAPMDNQWYSQDTSRFAKLSLTDFAASANWQERQDQHWSGPWLALKDSSINEPLITTQTFAKNRGFYLAWFSYGTGDTFLQMKCGWNDTANDQEGIALHIFTDGLVQVFKEGELLAEGKITGSKSQEVRNQRVFELLLIPGRHSELLLISKTGDGIRVHLNEISPTEPDPEITPSAPFWFQIQQGSTQVQIAPLRFPSTGYATSLRTSLADAPLAGSILEQFDLAPFAVGTGSYKINGHPGYGLGSQTVTGTLTTWDGVTPFAANGIDQDVRLRLELSTSDEGYSPFVYGAQMAYRAESQGTNDAEQSDCTSHLRWLRLYVPDEPRARLSGELIDPTSLSIVAPQLERIRNRPALVKLGSIPCLDGRFTPSGATRAMDESADSLQFTIRDAWQALENYTFTERLMLDGFRLDEVITFLGGLSCVPTLHVSTDAFRIPTASGEVSGRWGTVIEPGYTAADWLKRIMETYSPNWIYGFRPKPDGSGTEFYALAPTDLPTTTTLTLYPSIADVLTFMEIPPDQATDYVFRSLQQGTAGSFANEVRVMGENLRSQRPIVSTKRESAAADPTVLPSLRPTNWLGETITHLLVDPTLTEESAVDRVCLDAFDQVTVDQNLVAFESTLLQHSSGAPLWRGDLINLHGLGNYRIRSLQCDFMFESDLGPYRKAHYVATYEEPAGR